MNNNNDSKRVWHHHFFSKNPVSENLNTAALDFGGRNLWKTAERNNHRDASRGECISWSNTREKLNCNLSRIQVMTIKWGDLCTYSKNFNKIPVREGKKTRDSLRKTPSMMASATSSGSAMPLNLAKWKQIMKVKENLKQNLRGFRH